MNTDYEQEHAAACKVARAAGQLLKNRFSSTFSVSHKGDVDLVTDVDQAAEAQIVSALRAIFPSDAFLAEEGGGADPLQGRCWVIDPLDGTTNFAHGLPWFAVSIALLVAGVPRVGVVYQPMLDELFTAIAGQGAWLNHQPIAVRLTTTLAQAFLATGFPYDRRTSPVDNLDHFTRLQKTAFACRRGGSAALDLAHVAAGRFDGYWEMKLKPWDIAAGMLLVVEAGGRVTDFAGAPVVLDAQEVLATNGHIHAPMTQVLQEGRRP